MADDSAVKQPKVYNSPDEFAEAYKTKYPQFKSMPNDQLVSKVVKAHPGFASRIKTASVGTPALKTSGASGSWSTPLKDRMDNYLNRIDSPKGSGQAVAEGVAKGVVRGAVGIPEGIIGLISHPINSIATPMETSLNQAGEAWKKGDYAEAAARGIEGVVPLIGPLVGSIQDRARAGDVAGAVTDIFMNAGTAKAQARIGALAKEKFTPTGLREYATTLNRKNLQLPSQKSAYRLAKEQINGSLSQLADKQTIDGKTVPGLIQKHLDAVVKQRDLALAKADASGATVDIKAEVDNAFATAHQASAFRTGEGLKDIKQLEIKIRNTLNPQNSSHLSPRNLTALKPSEAHMITQMLEKPSGFDGSTPHKFAETAARTVRKQLSDKINQAAPGVGELKRNINESLEAKESINKRYNDHLEDRKATMMSIWRAGPMAVLTMVAMREFGAGYVAAVALPVAMRALWKSAKSTTVRAAAASKMADWLDRVTKVQPPTAAPSPQGGVTNTGQGGGLGGAHTSPHNAPQALGGTPAPTPAAAPPTANPSASAGQLSAPAQAATPTPALAAPVAKPVPRLSAAPEATPTPAPPSTAAPIPEVTKVPEGVSGSPKAKAMLDRLDVLYDRLKNPKSGKDRNDLVRMIDEIKNAVNDTNMPKEERAALQTRIKHREYVQKQREVDKAAVQGQGMSSSEAASTSTPETALAVKELGFKEIEKFPDGAKTVSELKKQFKDNNVDSATQMETIQMVLESLREFHGGGGL